MFQFVWSLAAYVLLSCQPIIAQNAFPGAVGFGAIATGGNGGTTYMVTNLDDGGPGSFRDAVSESNRNIVFDVGGYILLKSAVSLSSDITINGQTAPGDGIGIMGGEVSASGQSNIIIRNLRMRQGTLDSDTGKSAFNMGSASTVILDHCSVAYGQWDSVDAVGAINITVSNSIIAFPIGQQFGAHVETGPSTFYGNLWVSAHNRQPLSKDDTQYVNNVVYNYQAGYTSGNTGGNFSHDIINNYFIAGPSTTSPSDGYYQMDSEQSVYAAGNYLDSNKDGALNGAAANVVGDSTVLSSPWESSSESLAKYSASDAVTAVLNSAGASPRDEVDTFAVSAAKSFGTSGTIYESQADTGLSNGGYGTLTSTSSKERR
ncbi:polysaccharide lyase family 1 protein [Rhizodiscina lignyota]|uniref:Polysaccharide lyase family 1 protein n=1 Tax=Rhizodiscina lignyota TaxID=1504668 RepID=A0A9P4LZK6_9PEZI|nr:polysaccharide lyase family 1 protein [Rhizodiscina lignyota]